jgi:hypothetical protein
MQHQLELTATHNRHGQNESLNENREHFTKQALIVLGHLLNGEYVDGLSMFKIHEIQDIRPRIAAIKKHYPVEEEKIPGAHGAKRWRIKPDFLQQYKLKQDATPET